MTPRALSFGSAAAAYERFRPGYPDALVERVLAYGTGPMRTALEIGAGTGKATRAFVRHGVEVLASEPDPLMLAELRRQVPGAATQQATFEEVSTEPTYDLVYAAASLHWTDSATRWRRIAALLRPGGTLASFGAPIQLATAADRATYEAARSPYLDHDFIPSPDGTPADAALEWPGTELMGSDLFTDVQQVVVERRWSGTAAEYVGYLSTVSAYLQLPSERRAEALRQVAAALPERVEISGDLTVHLARRAG
ncbi:class I SAM-dependent methyltransferase [Solicola gregarius]|uniref:Class I SAM-dependent methyltransferase n=1 Tax=Solicola gregarius TaxID=2908642 RepID=A0AA46TKY6_9ACTN|nr:class I SAM-dependent methyltransferase [Solicola gregarius]UYM06829.1 class I SAM-dependent methyltransferase [Solicola gregarius]